LSIFDPTPTYKQPLWAANREKTMAPKALKKKKFLSGVSGVAGINPADFRERSSNLFWSTDSLG